MKLLKRVVIILFAFLAISTVAYSAVFSHVFRGMMIESSDFTRISEHVYVSPGTPVSQQDSLLAFLDTAHYRNQQFWGERIAYPDVIYCHNPEIAKKYGYGGGPASFFMTPFYSFVLVAPEGLHPEVLSHEMTHPELFERAGWWTHEMAFPVWFFEGVAMQNDYRPFYSDSAWQVITNQGQHAPELHEIEDSSTFFNGEFQLNYATAKREIHRWLGIVGQEGLQELIEKSSSRKEFHKLYREIEEKASAKKQPI